jgi:quinol monooxygenase YgiN
MPITQSIEELREKVSKMLDRLDPDMPIGSTVVFKVRKAKEGPFEGHAAVLADATQKLPGCKIFDFHRHQSIYSDPMQDPMQFLIYEEWDTVKQFRVQWDSGHLKHFQAGVMDWVIEAPDLDFYIGQTASGRLHIQKTGQTLCFSASGQKINCKGTGQDAEFRRGATPTVPRFTNNLDGTVTDRLTGLTWLQDADTFGPVSWEQALSNARNLASGYHGLSDGSVKGDWRLSNIRELLSLIDYGKAAPILPDGNHFTNVKAGIYWTSTTLAPAPLLSWMMTLGIGPTVFDVKTSPVNRMWPVRGQGRILKTGQKQCWDSLGNLLATCQGTGQDGELQAGTEPPNPRFTDNNDGTVTDNHTGLVWLKRTNPFGLRIWVEALELCNNLCSGSYGLTDGSVPGDWRLPNIREAESVVDYGQFGPCLPNRGKDAQGNDIFIDLRPSSYWTSTSVTVAPTEAMFIIYGVGPTIFESKEHQFFVWPVRDKARVR